MKLSSTVQWVNLLINLWLNTLYDYINKRNFNNMLISFDCKSRSRVHTNITHLVGRCINIGNKESREDINNKGYLLMHFLLIYFDCLYLFLRDKFYFSFKVYFCLIISHSNCCTLFWVNLVLSFTISSLTINIYFFYHFFILWNHKELITFSFIFHDGITYFWIWTSEDWRIYK